jgi:predicted transcriptional regulator of viral defense system
MGTVAFMQSRQVFTLAEARRALLPGAPAERVRNRLKRYLGTGRLLSVSRGVYAAVPFGIEAGRFQPDPFLVASSVRADAVFSHYSALTLLGAARVVWKVLTVLTASRRAPPRDAAGTGDLPGPPRRSRVGGDSARRQVGR